MSPMDALTQTLFDRGCEEYICMYMKYDLASVRSVRLPPGLPQKDLNLLSTGINGIIVVIISTAPSMIYYCPSSMCSLSLHHLQLVKLVGNYWIGPY